MRPRKVKLPHCLYTATNIERALIPTLHSLPFSNVHNSFYAVNPIAEILSLPGEKWFFVFIFIIHLYL